MFKLIVKYVRAISSFKANVYSGNLVKAAEAFSESERLESEFDQSKKKILEDCKIKLEDKKKTVDDMLSKLGNV